MTGMLDFIKSRRSTRKFKNEMVPEKLIEKIVEAGRYAPSGGNSQSTHFIVIENREVLVKLADLAKEEFAKMEVTENTYKWNNNYCTHACNRYFVTWECS